MIEKLIEINKHKLIAITIQEVPVFQCALRQFFVEDANDFKNGIPNKDDSCVMMGLNFYEFSMFADEISKYNEELKKTSSAMMKMAEAVEKAKEK